jgi:hypothetical protein
VGHAAFLLALVLVTYSNSVFERERGGRAGRDAPLRRGDPPGTALPIATRGSGIYGGDCGGDRHADGAGVDRNQFYEHDWKRVWLICQCDERERDGGGDLQLHAGRFGALYADAWQN